ncbi:hypothetical protein FIBSPDRAFT_903370 [Athelia psychrophila]|uniref:Uncharacterized protein n=1 Tax=Athelia psychrophila TaxID=1759441 RepID=A0A167W3K8_9AGAM|nr:hypothetical protein FIBSPDRAFT_903370 [Fibularhizoctonia sp. CBS 109695]
MHELVSKRRAHFWKWVMTIGEAHRMRRDCEVDNFLRRMNVFALKHPLKDSDVPITPKAQIIKRGKPYFIVFVVCGRLGYVAFLSSTANNCSTSSTPDTLRTNNREEVEATPFAKVPERVRSGISVGTTASTAPTDPVASVTIVGGVSDQKVTGRTRLFVVYAAKPCLVTTRYSLGCELSWKFFGGGGVAPLPTLVPRSRLHCSQDIRSHFLSTECAYALLHNWASFVARVEPALPLLGQEAARPRWQLTAF